MEKFNEKHILTLLSDPRTRKTAFETVVREYSEKLYWQIRRIVLDHEDTNDVLQNTFIKAWNNLEDFRCESKISTWLYRIAINESLDFKRRQKDVTSIDNQDDSVANTLMADEFFDGEETHAQLQQAISMLPNIQRTVFNMRYFDEMKYSEMSEILKTSEGALKASYHIAVQKISDFFKSHD